MKLHVLCVLGLSLGLARLVHADPLPADVDVPAETRAALQRVLDEASAAGVPAAPLLDKIREGRAKHVPPARLVPAVQALAAQLRDADALVRKSIAAPGGAEAIGLAREIVDARAREVQVVQLQRLLVAAKDGATATRAVATTSDLIARGYPRDAVVDAVTALLGRQPAALSAFTGAVERARLRGASTAESLELAVRDVGKGGPDRGAGNGRALGKGRSDDDPGKGPPEGRGPDRETNGARGKGAGKGKGNGKGND